MGWKFGHKFMILRKFSSEIFGEDFSKLYVQSGGKFQCTDNLDNLDRFSCILTDKNNINICWNW